MLRCQTLMAAPQRQVLRRLQKPLARSVYFSISMTKTPYAVSCAAVSLSSQHRQLVNKRISEKMFAPVG